MCIDRAVHCLRQRHGATCRQRASIGVCPQLLLQCAGEPIANQRAVRRLHGRADGVEQALHRAEQPRGAQGLPLGRIRAGQHSQTPRDCAPIAELTARARSPRHTGLWPLHIAAGRPAAGPGRRGRSPFPRDRRGRGTWRAPARADRRLDRRRRRRARSYAEEGQREALEPGLAGRPAGGAGFSRAPGGGGAIAALHRGHRLETEGERRRSPARRQRAASVALSSKQPVGTLEVALKEHDAAERHERPCSLRRRARACLSRARARGAVVLRRDTRASTRTSAAPPPAPDRPGPG